MLTHNIHCNICHQAIQYHPCAGANCLSLNLKGPYGEGSVVETDDYPAFAEHSYVHICRKCEKGLRTFFAQHKEANV